MEISGSPDKCIDLCEVKSEKDLGLWTTSSLKPPLYCEKAAATATKFLEVCNYLDNINRHIEVSSLSR